MADLFLGLALLLASFLMSMLAAANSFNSDNLSNNTKFVFGMVMALVFAFFGVFLLIESIYYL